METTYRQGYEGEHEAGNADFDYSEISDEDSLEIKTDLVDVRGFFILPSELFKRNKGK